MPLKELLQDIILYLREFPDDEVVASDDRTHSMVGWVSYDPTYTHPEQVWRVHLNELQRFLATDDGDHFRFTLGSTQGRRDTAVTLRKIADRDKWHPEAAEKYLIGFIGDPVPPPKPEAPTPKSRFEIMDDLD